MGFRGQSFEGFVDLRCLILHSKVPKSCEIILRASHSSCSFCAKFISDGGVDNPLMEIKVLPKDGTRP